MSVGTTGMAGGIEEKNGSESYFMGTIACKEERRK